MQTVKLEDVLSVSLNHNHSTITLRCDALSLKTDASNLVYRAAAAVLEERGQTVGLDIILAKRIPMGAGLGGGSSDAAATIIGLNRLLNLKWSSEKMAQVGQALGSDVPFFFYSPAAVVEGRGEKVTPVRIEGTRWIVLVNPGFPVETKWAYQQLSAGRDRVVPVSPSHAAWRSNGVLTWEAALKTVENDFEAPVFKAHPVLRTIKQELLEQGAEAALLSGSGATVFGVFRDEVQARHAQEGFLDRPEFKIFVAETHPRS
jgi:4-diphosphocytidyl-2-C-methyl-D-erythritol kinase